MSITLHSQEVTVDRIKLIQILKENRDKHFTAYEKAVGNYRLALIVDLEEALSKARANEDLKKIKVDFTYPQSHVQEYDNVLQMLEMSVSDTLILDDSAFKAYVRDEWVWKHQFNTLSTTYALKASTFQE